MSSSIDKIKCTFESPELEQQYLDDKWTRVSSFYSKVIIFFVSASSLYLVSLFLRNTVAIKNIINPIIFITFPLFLIFKSDDFKKKYLERFLLFLPIINMPLFNSIIWISIFPFNFINAVLASTIPFLASLTLLTNYDSLNIPLYIVLYFVPHTLLILNKWKFERDNRLNFSKSKTIEENRQLMQETLKRYFGDTLSDKIISQKGELEGENKWVTILFADLSAYSTITENMSPEVALEFLNEYFSKMHEVIKEFNGHTLNYIGDSVMVVFGAPEKLKDHEIQAVKCSLKMKEKLKELNQEWDEKETSRYWKNHDIQSITMRIGIHTGSVIAGNVGSQEMLQYSTIGDTVNVAARLEQANKDYETDISFSQEIYTALTKELNSKANLSGEIVLKGRTTPTKVYSI